MDGRAVAPTPYPTCSRRLAIAAALAVFSYVATAQPAPETVPQTGIVTGLVQYKETLCHPELVRQVLPDLERRHEAAYRALFTQRLTPAPGIAVILENDETGRVAVTDDDGRYLFGDVPSGPYQVYAIAPPDTVQLRAERDGGGRKQVTVAATAAVVEADLVLSRDAVSATGRVANLEGEPVVGARVSATPLDVVPPEGDDGYDRVRSSSVETVTDDEGHYILSGLLPAEHMEAFAFQVSGGRSLPQSGKTYIVRAEAPGYASAELTAPAIPAKWIDLNRAMLRELRSNPAYAEAIDDLPPDSELASAPTGPGNTLVGIDFALEAEAVLSGVLIDSRGQPVVNAKLGVVRPDAPIEGPRPFTPSDVVPPAVTTDASGAFRIGALPGGSYVFECDAGAGLQRTRNPVLAVGIGANIDDLQVVVESPADRGDVDGTVVDAQTGTPIAEYSLRVAEVDAPTEPSPRLGEISQDGETGAFRITGVSAGTATLEVQSKGYGTQRFTVAVRRGGATTTRVALAREGILRGRVLVNGRPAGGGYVVFPEWDGGPEAHIGPEGEYEIGALPAGSYVVSFIMWLYEDQRGGAQAVYQQRVAIATGQVATVDVAYGGTGVVRGAFSGPPDAKWLVGIKDAAAPDEIASRGGTWKFQENGCYELPEVPPGRYRVVATCTHADGAVEEQSETVRVSEGETVVVDFDFL